MSEIKEKTEGGFAHTPGPWWAAIGEDQPAAYYRGIVAYISGSDPIITVCTGTDGDKDGIECSYEQWQANARLIAASPCMFEALSNLEKQVVNGRDDASLIVELGDSDLLHAISIARAALQKAVGGGHG